MPTTVTLVRWFGGWREVYDLTGIAAYGRRSALLSLGAIQAVEEVDRVAGAELRGLFAQPREQMTVEHRPRTIEERPYIGYIPGSTCTAPNFDGDATEFPVLSISVSMNDDGELEVAPTIGDVIVGVDELQDHLISAPPARRRLPPGWETGRVDHSVDPGTGREWDSIEGPPGVFH